MVSNCLQGPSPDSLSGFAHKCIQQAVELPDLDKVLHIDLMMCTSGSGSGRSGLYLTLFELFPYIIPVLLTR